MRARIIKAVAEYTGREVVRVQITPDPEVPDVYAVRAHLAEVDPVDFLFSPWSGTPDIDCLEEVMWEVWPPQRAPSGVGAWRIS